MGDEQKLNPEHQRVRQVLRIVGPSLVLIGGILTLIGLVSFFSAFGTMGPPRYFWCAMVGMPVGMIGLMMTLFAYMGAIARYQAGEVAPVGKDTFNYMADGTQQGVSTLASAVARGFREGAGPEAQACGQCSTPNDPGAKFCDSCGTPLQRVCTQCGTVNDPAARFCDDCGQALAAVGK